MSDIGHLGCKTRKTPIDVNVKLAQDDGELIDDHLQYKHIIGKLLYLTITKPNLCYAVNLLSKFLAKLRIPHLQIVVHVLQYIKNTVGQVFFILFQFHYN